MRHLACRRPPWGAATRRIGGGGAANRKPPAACGPEPGGARPRHAQRPRMGDGWVALWETP